MLRRLVALALGLPVLVAAVAACGDDSADSNGGPSDAVKHGQELSRTKGCSACHGANGEGGLGPAWINAVGSTVTLTDGSQVVVDEAYLSRSITDPTAQVVDGFSVAMPVQQLTPQEVADLVAYLVSLSKPG